MDTSAPRMQEAGMMTSESTSEDLMRFSQGSGPGPILLYPRRGGVDVNRRPVRVAMSQTSCQSCHVTDVMSELPCHRRYVKVAMSQTSCQSCHVTDVLSELPCHRRHVRVTMSQTSCQNCHVVDVMSELSCHRRHARVAMSQTSCQSCHVTDVMSQSCHVRIVISESACPPHVSGHAAVSRTFLVFLAP
ncbi:putative proline-rich protein 21 [Penaeus chinensis]|uniref:putative proline-rich protein 21 n=1 Tax=Penaeus chinensis TaxID=139456 RepID=UPI001FB636FD|nr:putative proline-rich protein 21 [Penaeus chinensis]